jgi:hypothetical protein
MKAVLEAIERRTVEFARHPFYAFLRDTTLDPRQKLGFVPVLSHFVMTFADLYALVLREEPARDAYQELVNAHTYEDGGHWKWFLADLDKLGHDPRLPFSNALKFVWSSATEKTRLLSYHMCRLGLGADSLHKLVLVQCIEATGKVTLEHVAPVGKQFAELTGKKLVYFGPHHFDTEAQHTLEEDGVHRRVEGITLEPALERELVALVDTCFALFSAGADELLAFARSGQRIDAAT